MAPDAPEPHRSNWRMATLATLTLDELRVILDLVVAFERTFGRDMTPEELAKALRGD